MSAKRKFKYEDIFEEEKNEDVSEMSELLEEENVSELSAKQIVKGKVVNISREIVTVDVGFKSEGRISVDELFSCYSRLRHALS